MTTQRRLVLPLRALLIAVFLGLLVAEFAAFPGDFLSTPPDDPVRLPTFLFLEAEAILLQVIIVCLWQLLTRLQGGRILERSSLRRMNVIAWSVVAGWLLFALAAAALMTYIYFSSERDPAPIMVLSGATLIGAMVVLLVSILRDLHRQAVAVGSDASRRALLRRPGV